MADCFSLPNAAELVERLRATAKVYYEDSAVLYPAADAIEQLLAENAKLKADYVFLSQTVKGLILVDKSRTEEIKKLKAERDAYRNGAGL